MTASLFNALGNLQQALTAGLATLSAQRAGAALNELRTVPGLRDLGSLEELTEPRRLTSLLFHGDRYEAVAERLGFPEDALRGIFGAETRASRLLPAVASVPVVPRQWNNRAYWKNAQKTVADAASAVTREWHDAKVRRIAPRGSEPIGVWTVQRTLLMGSTGVIAECFAYIEEIPGGVENFAARLSFKITDYNRGMISRERVLELFRSPLLGTLWAREGVFESSFVGTVPARGHDWRATHVPGNLAITFQSPAFPRKKPETLKPFFDGAGGLSADVLGFFLAASEG